MPRRPAFVTGGSSGIGLAVAGLLADEGRDLALFARDPVRLEDARAAILERKPDIRVEIFPVDVRERDMFCAAVARGIETLGTPEIAIASAGLATPGLFTEQPVELHEDHMAINYFGSLFFAHALTGPMRDAGGGKIAFISSGAAFFGIYGYSAYAPSKFAVRGLAEVLHIELKQHGIGVTLCYPPDTDTPQLAQEMHTKPAATRKITEGGGLWSAEAVARDLLRGMNKGRFIVAPGMQMKVLHHLTSVIHPGLRAFQNRVLRKTDRSS
ncbi:3-dehydrosphinganine reductase [Salinihabitans flavidus]|uniref:3-dehydrosphinganine reductase n=1 Tax=Salinihabitans flavidus TaxID=569882 RepID=A0A1H8QVB6_9RHOB|nr:SDR family oxidoreductase [Salinihabitans flavidus]SEO57794.1 3-dehydrosphinganine reductase [Salinihabitans flavidus]